MCRWAPASAAWRRCRAGWCRTTPPRLDIVPVRLGAKGIAKQIHLGAREADLQTDYLEAFVELARGSSAQGGNGGHVGR